MYSTLSLILSNAVSLRRDKSILFSRVAIIVLFYFSLLIIISLFINSLNGIGLYGGLYHASGTQILKIFIFAMSTALLKSRVFYPGRVLIAKYLSLETLFLYKLLHYLYELSINLAKFRQLIIHIFKFCWSITLNSKIFELLIDIFLFYSNKASIYKISSLRNIVGILFLNYTFIDNKQLLIILLFLFIFLSIFIYLLFFDDYYYKKHFVLYYSVLAISFLCIILCLCLVYPYIIYMYKPIWPGGSGEPTKPGGNGNKKGPNSGPNKPFVREPERKRRRSRSRFTFSSGHRPNRLKFSYSEYKNARWAAQISILNKREDKLDSYWFTQNSYKYKNISLNDEKYLIQETEKLKLLLHRWQNTDNKYYTYKD